MQVKCQGCKKTRFVNSSSESLENYTERRPFCISCGHKNRIKTLGGHAPNWKGGRHVDSHGYVRVWSKKERRYLKEHHVVFGAIPHGYVLHHKDGNKQNNDLKNLQLLNKKDHDKLNPMIRMAADIRWGNLTVKEARSCIGV